MRSDVILLWALLCCTNHAWYRSLRFPFTGTGNLLAAGVWRLLPNFAQGFTLLRLGSTHTTCCAYLDRYSVPSFFISHSTILFLVLFYYYYYYSCITTSHYYVVVLLLSISTCPNPNPVDRCLSQPSPLHNSLFENLNHRLKWLMVALPCS